ncbi:MAG: penicillin-binding protein 2 [Longimicrobiales bacterium]|nr:penicillin-binding protein 2 [Longimicrobiales bacterium]
MNIHHPHELQRRAVGAHLAVALFLSALIVGFFRIQVLGSDTWALRAASNRIRTLPIPAPRGTIYDREGRIVADNVPGYSITILPGPRDSVRATLERMSRYVELSDERVERLMDRMRVYGREVVVDANADFAAVAALEERRTEFPGVYVDMRPRRRYLMGGAGGHVTGYVGEITAEELGTDAFPEDRYEAGMVVGKIGIEREYEAMLQGQQGVRYVEFDARGRIVGDFEGVETRPAVAGEDLHLNLDMELQDWIHRIFPDSMSGAVVALDPEDGGVLALYSAPGYDPNDFVGGIADSTWARLNADEEDPLFNRSVLGLYAPASTWKLATAGIALDLGVVTPDQTMPEPCTGSWYWGNRSWGCWDPEGHGYNNLAEAIGNSCDVYFYQLGLRIGLERLLRRSTQIGFSRQCGIDLPQESRGEFPDRKEWYRERFGDVYLYGPTEGEALNLAIGQGPNSQTPLKMAQFYVALARDGSAPAPMLARGNGVAEGWELDLSAEHIAALQEGLRRVTAPGGTAHFGTALEHWDVLGKTGTGQNPLSVRGLAEDHAWFAGLAGPPGERPEVVVVALVEYGRSGGQVAAPIVAKTADFYLRRKYGIPVDTIQTYREHIMTGPVPAWYRERFPSAFRSRPASEPAIFAPSEPTWLSRPRTAPLDSVGSGVVPGAPGRAGPVGTPDRRLPLPGPTRASDGSRRSGGGP